MKYATRGYGIVGAALSVARPADVFGTSAHAVPFAFSEWLVIAGLAALLLDAPLPLLVPVLIAAGVLSMSWNSLSFAAAVELAGHGRSGSAIGLQQTLLNGPGAAYPGLFGALVATSSWRVGFAVVALFPLAGWRVLRALPG